MSIQAGQRAHRRQRQRRTSNALCWATLLLYAAGAHAQSGLSLGERLGQSFAKAAKATGAIKDYGSPPRVVPKGGKPVIALKSGRIYFNDKELVLGDSMANWKKIIGQGAVCGEKQWPLWCKWDALGIAIGTSMKKNEKVEYIKIYLNDDPDKDEPGFPDLDRDGKPAVRPWIVTGLFPGYLEFDGFGIDRRTKFWEIRSSVDRRHELRCGLQDCTHPIGKLNDDVSIYMVLNGKNEYAEVREISLSAGEN